MAQDDGSGGSTGENTAADVLSGVGNVAGFIPGVGSIISAATSIGSGLLKNDAAKKQMARAQALRDQQVQKAAIDPNYLRKLRMDEFTALQGTPGYGQAKSNLEQSSADNLRAIRESSPSGNATLSAMATALAAKNASLNTLAGQNAQYKANGQAVVSGDLSTLGEQGQARSNDARSDRKDLNAAATNLENAGTANKIGSIDQILSSVGALGSPKAGLFTGGTNPDGTPKTTTTAVNPVNLNPGGAGGATGSPELMAKLKGLDPVTQAAVLDFIRKNPQYNASGNSGFSSGTPALSVENSSDIQPLNLNQ